jgi:hypothetical protein
MSCKQKFDGTKHERKVLILRRTNLDVCSQFFSKTTVSHHPEEHRITVNLRQMPDMTSFYLKIPGDTYHP